MTSSCHGCLLCAAKPRQLKPNQTHPVVEGLFTEGQTIVSVENRGKTESVPHADTNNDDDIFADTFSSPLKTQLNAGISKQSVAVTVNDDIFATAPATSAVKTRHLQSKKASNLTSAFNIDSDDDEDIFAVKPSSISIVKNPVAATGNATQKVCHCGL